ncbi:MAG TPA: pantoate--beta-alanine ligase [Marmoricola sp.]|nr:pantoate--beta-alanine ligase [Marmoricola sp.]
MSRPLVARTRGELESALSSASSDRPRGIRRGQSDEAGSGRRIALVPTMGALHAGHAALLSTARSLLRREDALVVSIFVNPLQFGPGEDLDRYPRSFDTDLELCAAGGVDVVFAPSVEEVYPGGEPRVTVDPGPLATVLEGASRPAHFRGVLTVVAKLFGLVRPDVAVFGQKDYQQLVLVRRMVEDLCMGIEVVGGETVREDDGLALSSRNRYLATEERLLARTLSAALRAGAAAGPAGPDAVRRAALAVLEAADGVDLDYLALTGPDLAEPPERGPARLLVAARVGATRLIDNVALTLEA